MVIADADTTLSNKNFGQGGRGGDFHRQADRNHRQLAGTRAGAVADTYELVRGFLSKLVRAVGDRLDQARRRV
jgi:hypothetical protein